MKECGSFTSRERAYQSMKTALQGVLDDDDGYLVERLQKTADILDDFASSYMMDRCYWVLRHRIALEFDNDKAWVCSQARFQFYYTPNDGIFQMIAPLLPYQLFDPKRVPRFEQVVLPNRHAKNILSMTESCNDSFFPVSIVKAYNVARDTCLKLEKLETSVVEWVMALDGVNNVEFFMQNVEHALSLDLDNHILWHLYIEYLEKKGLIKDLLMTLSKYCRFYTNDVQMFMKYGNLAKLNGQNKLLLPWKNAFQFERHTPLFNVIMENADMVWHKCTSSSTLSMKSRHTWTIPFALSYQTFSLPNPMMRRMMESGDGPTILRLQKCAKLFAVMSMGTIILHSFSYAHGTYYSEAINFKGESLQITTRRSVVDCLNGIGMEKQPLQILSSLKVFCHMEPLALSSITPRIQVCTAKYISVCHQRLSVTEMKKLIGHGAVIHLKLVNVKNAASTNQFFSLEFLLKLVPKAQKICIVGFEHSRDTSSFLAGFRMTGKLQTLNLNRIADDSIAIVDLMAFLKNNVEDYGKVDIATSNIDYAGVLRSSVSTLLKEWHNKAENETKDAIQVYSLYNALFNESPAMRPQISTRRVY